MRYRRLGTVERDVSAIGVGTWAIGGDKWGPIDDSEAVRAIQRAVDLGVTLFDSVDAFGEGHSEELLGQALRGRRHGITVVAKGGVDFTRRPHRQDFSLPYLDRALGESLRRLHTDYVDVYMLHSPPVEVICSAELYDWLEVFRAEGRIRAYGVSLAEPLDALAAISFGRIESLMVPFNLLDQAMAKDVLPAAERAGIGVLARAPLALGVLAGAMTADTHFHTHDFRSGWDRDAYLVRLQKVERLRWLVHDDIRTLSQAALAFVLSNPGICAAVPGFSTVHQVEENAVAGELFPLPQEDLDEIAELYEDDFGLALASTDANPWETL